MSVQMTVESAVRGPGWQHKNTYINWLKRKKGRDNQFLPFEKFSDYNIV